MYITKEVVRNHDVNLWWIPFFKTSLLSPFTFALNLKYWINSCQHLIYTNTIGNIVTTRTAKTYPWVPGIIRCWLFVSTLLSGEGRNNLIINYEHIHKLTRLASLFTPCFLKQICFENKNCLGPTKRVLAEGNYRVPSREEQTDFKMQVY